MNSPFFRIPSYHAFLSPQFARELLSRAAPVNAVPGLVQLGESSGLETPEALRFLVDLVRTLENDLQRVLAQRAEDRAFIDTRVRALVDYNRKLGIDFLDPEYRTALGLTDAQGRVVFGPLRPDYCQPGGNPVAPIPDYLQGPHVTLFGPPDGAKMAINAMNAYHRKLPNEPAIVTSLLEERGFSPMWGADDEDSKTPLRSDLIDAGVHLAACFDGTLKLDEGSKSYRIVKENQSLPIKRFPGLALPASFLFIDETPVPLHLYDFALHLFHHWNNPRALVFYLPKIENEEEARYVHRMIAVAEDRLKALHPTYAPGTVRLLVVLENPRAILRAHEIMDALHPYFAGASLGWHDYLASTARLFKEDPNYRIPVKADPNIVVKYIKASHLLVADVVGSRGGIKIGGMYGILPLAGNTESMQVTLRGFFKDVITQLKRNLSGFWVAHPDFVRIGIALVIAWQKRTEGQSESLRALVEGLLEGSHREEILHFIDTHDVPGLSVHSPGYVRSLIVADIKQSDFVANDDPEEVRYNVFQSLQYLADWLSGNGCVALPTTIDGVPVRVMDDLATAERSRWEVWHEVHHGRVSIPTLIRIVHEEMNFIRRGLSGQDPKKTKLVQVAWDERTSKWYPIAKRILLRLMTDAQPPEFATELLLPFTVEHIRAAEDPWKAVLETDPHFDGLNREIADFDHYFELCGAVEFASKMAASPIEDPALARATILSFTKEQIIESAGFHGDIGQNKATLDVRAASEQAAVTESSAAEELRTLAIQYREKFGIKYLVSAKGRSTEELLANLRERIDNSEAQELDNARHALWEITRKRMLTAPRRSASNFEALLRKHGLASASIAVSRGTNVHEFVVRNAEHPGSADVDVSTAYQIASLSKTVGSALALELLQKRGIFLDTPVHSLLAHRLQSKSNPEWANRVVVADLMRHTALNMHYVKGIPARNPRPRASTLLDGNNRYGYEPVQVLSKPGTTFNYSGGGFLVLETLLEALEGRTIFELLHEKFPAFVSPTDQRRARGYFDSGEPVPGGALQFPALAAGLWATAGDMTRFLQSLTSAYHDTHAQAISHDTAVRMLYGRNLGSMDFMGCDMGLGVFVAEAGPNRLAIHQGANEGFRCIFVHCFDGPDRGKGFTIFCNGDNRAVAFVAEAARELLLALDVQGIDMSKLAHAFDFQGLAQEEIVNLGYKQLLFAAFEPDLPEAIVQRGPEDPLATRNLVIGAKIISVTNQKFARAENLISDREPIFDPELFGRQGKIMDSWESARHNPRPHDTLDLELRESSTIRFVQLSTKYHDGNQPEFVAVKAWDEEAHTWLDVVAQVRASGHALYRARVDLGERSFRRIRVEITPDGGLSRLGLFSDLPDDVAKEFVSLEEAVWNRFAEAIPKTRKPMTLPFAADGDAITRTLDRLEKAGHMNDVDWASAAFGGELLGATNEHYGPAVQVISPYPPLHMFDGLESARSRDPGHYEEARIRLGRPIQIGRIELDFRFFVNNNPREVEILAAFGNDGEWIPIVPRIMVKPFAGNRKVFLVASTAIFDRILVRTHPDGGVNRVHVYASKDYPMNPLGSTA